MLRLTDLFVSGDTFSIVINGGPPTFFSTPVPNPGFVSLLDADGSYSSGEYSTFTHQFDPGVYTLTIGLTGIAPCLSCDPSGNVSWTGGIASLRVDTPVPEPASLLLVGTGVAGLLPRRRTKAQRKSGRKHGAFDSRRLGR